MTIFMIGTQRSGSNLLRLMLNQQPAIAAPHPPHILERFMPLLPHYGDLGKDENFDLLVNDICRMIEANPVPWSGVDPLDRELVKSCCMERSLPAVYGAVHDLMSEAKGALVWCCKSLANVHYLKELREFFFDARYIHLYRDGRDVAISFRNAVVGEKSFYHIALQWHREQQLALAHKRKIPSPSFFGISYEDLTQNPESILREMMLHFAIPFKEEMLQFYISEEAKATAKCGALWANVNQPIIGNNTRKFLRDTDPEDIRIFELVAGESLEALGFERAFTRKGETKVFDDREIKAFELENRRLKEAMSGRANPEEMRLREPQANLLREIRQRFGIMR